MGGTGAKRATLALVGALALAGCGGNQRQDANAPSGTFPVEVSQASFPSSQQLAQPVVLKVVVRNRGRRALPDLALTVHNDKSGGDAGSFALTLPRKGSGAALADPARPIWILNHGPSGGDTAYVDTWATGALKPGRSRAFTFHLTPIRSGSYTLFYRVFPALEGDAKAELPGGGIPKGSFHVQVSGTPNTADAGSQGNG